VQLVHATALYDVNQNIVCITLYTCLWSSPPSRRAAMSRNNYILAVEQKGHH
jgi:hypothetical protein